jgi:hypothetical protein
MGPNPGTGDFRRGRLPRFGRSDGRLVGSGSYQGDPRTTGSIGDELSVMVRWDDEERTVPVPDDVMRRPAGHRLARATFEALSYSHRGECVRWIEEAKRPEARRRRIQVTIDRLEGIT